MPGLRPESLQTLLHGDRFIIIPVIYDFYPRQRFALHPVLSRNRGQRSSWNRTFPLENLTLGASPCYIILITLIRIVTDSARQKDAGMAEIQPFKTVHYNQNLSAELGRLITPPYDIISPEEQEGFYQVHPSNIIRLVLGKQFSDDSETNNRYTRAAAALKQWIKEGNPRPGRPPGNPHL
jgi:hypothetical protein